MARERRTCSVFSLSLLSSFPEPLTIELSSLSNNKTSVPSKSVPPNRVKTAPSCLENTEKSRPGHTPLHPSTSAPAAAAYGVLRETLEAAAGAGCRDEASQALHSYRNLREGLNSNPQFHDRKLVQSLSYCNGGELLGCVKHFSIINSSNHISDGKSCSRV